MPGERSFRITRCGPFPSLAGGNTVASAVQHVAIGGGRYALLRPITPTSPKRNYPTQTPLGIAEEPAPVLGQQNQKDCFDDYGADGYRVYLRLLRTRAHYS